MLQFGTATLLLMMTSLALESKIDVLSCSFWFLMCGCSVWSLLFCRIQLAKVLSEGYDDSSWSLQTKTGRYGTFDLQADYHS